MSAPEGSRTKSSTDVYHKYLLHKSNDLLLVLEGVRRIFWEKQFVMKHQIRRTFVEVRLAVVINFLIIPNFNYPLLIDIYFENLVMKNVPCMI